MSIRQLRLALHGRIDEIDERFLRVMYAMTETYIKEQEDAEIATQIENVPPDESWQPLTEEELMERLEASTKAYKNGEYTDIEDIEKESEEW